MNQCPSCGLSRSRCVCDAEEHRYGLTINRQEIILLDTILSRVPHALLTPLEEDIARKIHTKRKVNGDTSQ